jgi:hypothetical protein
VGDDLPEEAAVTLILGIVLGLAFAMMAAVALDPSLQNGTRVCQRGVESEKGFRDAGVM